MRFYELLIEYNVINVDKQFPKLGIKTSIMDFIKTLTPRVSSTEAENWLNKNLKKALINDEANLQKVKPINMKDAAPEWAIDASQTGDLYVFGLDPSRESEINHLLDWFNVLAQDSALEIDNADPQWNKKVFATKELSSLPKVKYDDAVEKSNKYFQMFRPKVKGQLEDKNVMMTFDDGYVWKEITTQKEAKIVGQDLQNCLGTVISPAENDKIFVLSSSNNKCSVAMSVFVDGNLNTVEEIKGKNNKPPINYKKYVLAFLNKFKFDATDSRDLRTLGYIQASSAEQITTVGEYLKSLPSEDIGDGITLTKMNRDGAEAVGVVEEYYYGAKYNFVLLFTFDDNTVQVKTTKKAVVGGLAEILKLPEERKNQIIEYFRGQGLENQNSVNDIADFEEVGAIPDKNFDLTSFNEMGTPIIDFSDGSTVQLLDDAGLVEFYHRRSGMTGKATKRMIVLYDSGGRIKFLATVSTQGFNKAVSVKDSDYIRGITDETSPYVKHLESLFKVKTDFGLKRETMALEALNWINNHPGDGVGSYYVHGRGNDPAGTPGSGGFGHIYTPLRTMGLVTIQFGGGGKKPVHITELGKKVLANFEKDPNPNLRFMPSSKNEVSIKKVYKENAPKVSKKFGQTKKI